MKRLILTVVIFSLSILLTKFLPEKNLFEVFLLLPLFLLIINGLKNLGGIILEKCKIPLLNGNPEKILFSLAIGEIFFSLIIFILAHVGLIHFTYFLLIPLIFLGVHFDKKQFKYFSSNNYFKYKEALLVFIYLILGSLVVLIPSSYYDPLNYHLVAPLKWYIDGIALFQHDATPLNHASLMEYLYLFMVEIFKGEKLIFIQIFCQLLHFFSGLLPFSLLVFIILKKIISEKYRPWIFIILLGIILRASLQHKAFIAKVDFMTANLSLLGLFLLYQGKEKKDYILSGVLLGSAFSTKFTSGYSNIFFILPWLFLKLREKKYDHFAVLIISGLLSTFPITVRNFLWTGNPFYPFLYQVFDTDLIGPTWKRGLQSVQTTSLANSIKLMPYHLKNIIAYYYTNFFYFIAPIIFYLFKDKKMLTFWIINSLGLFLYFLMTSHMGETRETILMAFAIPFISLYSLMLLITKFKNISWIPFLLGILFLIKIFTLSDNLTMFPKNVATLFKKDGLKDYILTIKGHQSLAYLEQKVLSHQFYQNRKERKLCMLDDFTPFYYWKDFYPVKTFDDALFDKSLYQTKSAAELKQRFVDYGCKAYLFSDRYFDSYYNSKIIKALENELNQDNKIQRINLKNERIYLP